ncbi:hypothetical protein HYC85_017772 [Camellia sinensis]|uniref:Uncharacterized protein n=1 Tax=Camellia sinensis TaxID=4442 RepID=A0A7J7GU13_CAMSI|nr:hypothetical protein HYC85_017772 [Camellia sinensis]
MARFLVVFIILAQLSIYMTKTNGSQDLDLMAPMAVFGHEDVSIPSPAPSSGGDSSGMGNGSGTRRITRHHSSDKSMAGGDVIVGGFATALVAAIYCYIRVTIRNQHDKTYYDDDDERQ